jgi:hypothetical protein
MTSVALASPAPQAVASTRRPLPSSSLSATTQVTLRSQSQRGRTQNSQNRLISISKDISAIDLLMIRHGQLECSRGARPIVPRCMTALPENISDFLESLLPYGG